MLFTCYTCNSEPWIAFFGLRECHVFELEDSTLFTVIFFSDRVTKGNIVTRILCEITIDNFTAIMITFISGIEQQ